jgi:hypothetical protein
MSNKTEQTREHLAIVNDLTPAEIEAWLRLQEAERELAEARSQVIYVTNREAGKRGM